MGRRFGQHFLTRGAVLERIAEAACPTSQPLVVEIGPGTGVLTERLLRRAERVVAIEIDSLMVERLARKFGAEPRLTVLHSNILDIDLAVWKGAVVCGNLPYYISSPILEQFATAAPALARGVFLLQKEVAERVTAEPGQRAYGYLTVQTRLAAIPELLFEVKPSAFRPPPKVDSALVRLEPNDASSVLQIADRQRFLAFVSLCFRQKRKTIRNNLSGSFPRNEVDALPQASLRAEQIPIAGFAEMYRLLYPNPEEEERTHGSTTSEGIS